MPKVTRIGDSFATGHGCTGTSTIAEVSGSVFVNNLRIARIGDAIDNGAITSGSPNVYAGD
jgi:uncharacterized Zn-binding protein involved in type VI secretion